GINQVPFLNVCKKNGYKTITIDKNTLSPGFAISDLKIVESITEYRKIYSFLLKTLLDAPIVGVGCRSYGKATISLSYLSEKLDVPGNKFEDIKKFYNKQSMNKFLAENRILTPLQIQFRRGKKLDFSFPLIAKPIDGDGKRDISIIQNQNQLNNLKKKKKNNIFIEEFIEGKEYTILGFVQGGEFHLVSVTSKITTESPPFLELAHIIPSDAKDLTGEFKFICQRIANLTNLENTPIVAEFKVDSKKNIYLIEFVPEIGGEYLADELLKNQFGYEYFEDYLRLITGKKISLYNKKKKNSKRSVIRFLAPPMNKSKVVAFNKIDSSKFEKIFFDKVLKNPGEIVNGSEGNLSRVRVTGFHLSGKEEIKLEPSKSNFYEVIFE
ncbi:MAG: ATP-grasp domain-containing protein, partial [Leptospiraceae bacterium]|nr:ATP-grasp domain-containing protein [Leptospiraceae bacterium]